jgi:flagellar hook assembly protein FlgD
MGPRIPGIWKDAFVLRYRNPSAGSVEFVLTLREKADVEVGIYDVRGRLITSPYGETLPPGMYAFAWDGKDSSGKPLGSGIYFCRVTAGRHAKTSKVVLLK